MLEDIEDFEEGEEVLVKDQDGVKTRKGEVSHQAENGREVVIQWEPSLQEKYESDQYKGPELEDTDTIVENLQKEENKRYGNHYDNRALVWTGEWGSETENGKWVARYHEYTDFEGNVERSWYKVNVGHESLRHGGYHLGGRYEDLRQAIQECKREIIEMMYKF